MKVYFNPNCSKCRNAVTQLDEKDASYEIVKYLETNLGVDELGAIIDILQDPIEDLVRKDKNFQALNLNPADYVERDSIVKLLAKHPELMQRPVIVKEGKAHIARTPEKVAELSR